jgi:hypothetical protein
MMSQQGDTQRTQSGRSDLVDQSVIAQFVGKVEPGGEVSLSVVIGTVVFSLLVVFGSTAWWMLH